MNPMYITNIAEYNQSCQALQQRQAYLSEQLEEAQAAEQAMRQEYQAATMTPADRLRKQFQAQQQAVAQARKDGRSQSEIAALEAQKNETYQSYLAAWNEENQAQRQAQEQQKQQNLQGLSESARHGSLAQQAQAALFAARRTPSTTSEEIQRLERVLESEKALAAQAGQAEQQARQAAQAQQTAASSQTQQELDDVNSRIWELESTNMMYTADASMAYTPEYLALLEKRERLKSQLSAQKEQEVQQVQSTMSWGTLEAWAQPGYTMSETEKAAARAALKEWNGVIGPDFDAYYEAARALREMGQSTKEIEILLYQAEIMDTLATKVSGVRSAFSGAGNALPLAPQVRGALEAENWRRAGFEGENPLGVAQRSQGAATQNPLAYHAGYLASSMGQYAAGSAAMKALPGVGRVLDGRRVWYPRDPGFPLRSRHGDGARAGPAWHPAGPCGHDGRFHAGFGPEHHPKRDGPGNGVCPPAARGPAPGRDALDAGGYFPPAGGRCGPECGQRRAGRACARGAWRFE